MGVTGLCFRLQVIALVGLFVYLYAISCSLPHPLVPSPSFIIFHSPYLHLLYMYLFIIYLLLFSFSQESKLHKGRDFWVFTSSSPAPSAKEASHKIITLARTRANDHFGKMFYFKANNYFRSSLNERGGGNPAFSTLQYFKENLTLKEEVRESHRIVDKVTLRKTDKLKLVMRALLFPLKRSEECCWQDSPCQPG